MSTNYLPWILGNDGNYETATLLAKLNSFLHPTRSKITAKQIAEYAAIPHYRDKMTYCNCIMKDLKMYPKVSPHIYYGTTVPSEPYARLFLRNSLAQFAALDYRLALGTLNQALSVSNSSYVVAKCLIARCKYYRQLGQFDLFADNVAQLHRLKARMNRSRSTSTFQSIGDAGDLSPDSDAPKMRDFSLNDPSQCTSYLQKCCDWSTEWRAYGNESTFDDEAIFVGWDSAMHTTRRFARVAALKRLHVGQVLAIDRSVSSTVVGDQLHQRCSMCARECLQSLYPCGAGGVCAQMFCSDICRIAADNYGHRYECELTRYAQQFEVLRPVLRLVFATFRSNSDLAEWREFEKGCDGDDPVFRNSVFKFARLEDLPRQYLAKQVFALSTRARQRTNAEQCYLTRVATFAWQIIKYHTLFVFLNIKTKEDRDMICRFLLRTTQAYADYGRVLSTSSSLRLAGERQSQRPVVRGLFPISSMIAHSCAPNVRLVACGTQQLAVVAVRPIEPFEMLTVDWTLGWAVEPDSDSVAAGVLKHRDRYREKFGGDCDCPQDFQRPGRVDFVFPHAGSALRLGRTGLPDWAQPQSAEWQHLFALPRTEVRRRWDVVCEFMEANDGLYPCRELYVARQCFDLCVERLFGTRLEYEIGEDEWSEASAAVRQLELETESKAAYDAIAAQERDVEFAEMAEVRAALEKAEKEAEAAKLAAAEAELAAAEAEMAAEEAGDRLGAGGSEMSSELSMETASAMETAGSESESAMETAASSDSLAVAAAPDTMPVVAEAVVVAGAGNETEAAVEAAVEAEAVVVARAGNKPEAVVEAEAMSGAEAVSEAQALVQADAVVAANSAPLPDGEPSSITPSSSNDTDLGTKEEEDDIISISSEDWRLDDLIGNRPRVLEDIYNSIGFSHPPPRRMKSFSEMEDEHKQRREDDKKEFKEAPSEIMGPLYDSDSPSEYPCNEYDDDDADPGAAAPSAYAAMEL